MPSFLVQFALVLALASGTIDSQKGSRQRRDASANQPIQLRSDSLRPTIGGQLGDSLRQLVWAILYAESAPSRQQYRRIVIRGDAFTKHFGDFLTVKVSTTNQSFPTPTFSLLSAWVVLELDRNQSQQATRSPGLRCHESLFHTSHDTGKPLNYNAKKYTCSGLRPREWERVLAQYVRPNLKCPSPRRPVGDDEW